MKRACIELNTTELASSTQLNTYEQNHASSIRPLKINFVRMKNALLIIGTIFLFSCKLNQSDNMKISKDEMLRIVKECDNQFSIGIQKRDSAFLTNIYSDSAQYVTPQKPILLGKIEIGKDWGGFLRIKEKPIDLILNIKEVRGNREIIYETGHGYTLLADSTKWTFNYVNVWRLQNDGSYKLEIDTYN